MIAHNMMKTFRLSVVLLFVAALAGSFAACGGKQKGDDGMTRQERKEQKALEKEMSPEELEALRQQEIDDDIDAAIEEYLAADTTEDRDYKSIRKRLKSILKERPDDGDVMFNLGILSYEEGDIDDAIEWWEKATESDETYTRGLANLGMLRLVDGDVDGAREIFNTCVERSQTAPGCNINLALISRNENLQDGKLTRETAQEAIDHLRFALGEDSNATAYADLARIYHEMDQLELARQVCENAIKLGIDEAPLHNRLGLIALADDDVITAYGEFQRAVQLDPEFLDAWMNIGAMALNFRDYEAAHQAFEMVLKYKDRLSSDNLVDATLSFGVAKRGLDDLEGAEEQYQKVLELRENDYRALYNLGVLHQEARGDYDTAVKWFTDVVGAPGADKELVDDAAQRIETLNALMELLEEDDSFGEEPAEEPGDES